MVDITIDALHGSRRRARLSDIRQALLQAVKLRTDLRFHGVLQCVRAPAGQFRGGRSVQILLPIPDCLFSGRLSLRRRLKRKQVKPHGLRVAELSRLSA